MSKSEHDKLRALLEVPENVDCEGVSATALVRLRKLRFQLERERAEVARLRGVIEGVSKWLENEASALREEGLTMWGNEQLLKSRQLRLALHPANTSQPQPVENGGEG